MISTCDKGKTFGEVWPKTEQWQNGQMCANYACEVDQTLVSYLSST